MFEIRGISKNQRHLVGYAECMYPCLASKKKLNDFAMGGR